MRRSIYFPMTSTSFPWLRSSPFATIAKICSTGLVLSCATYAGKTILAVVFDSAPTISVVDGRSTLDNLQNAEGVDAPNIAAKNAKKVPGSIIAIGVSLPHNSLGCIRSGSMRRRHVNRGFIIILFSSDSFSTSIAWCSRF
jgi:hypothetical protein